MAYVPITPFRRPVDAGLLQHVADADTADLPPQGANKWEVLRELGVARQRVGVTDRELTVLQALLTFHPETVLGGNSDNLIVFPSNVAICDRLNGMPCSTMRRHLAGLVRCGLLVRRDSPNGKRYVRGQGDQSQAFGFDLTPLVARFHEICALAEAVRAEDEAYRRLRQQVSLMRRDLAGLAVYGAEHAPLPLWSHCAALAASVARDLRRKLRMDELNALAADLAISLDKARDALEGKTQNTSINDANSEHHYQNSNTNIQDLEPCLEKAKAKPVAKPPDNPHGTSADLDAETTEADTLPNIPLGLVLAVCTEFRQYVPDQVRHWHQLVRAADVLRPMMGISPSAWQDAVHAMGPEQAAVVVLAMLERTAEIKSPGGYLRHLTLKAERGEFSCGPMVMALTRREASVA